MTDKAKIFAELHVKGSPLVLYNCWDAGSAAAIAASGAKALATGSWAVAVAQGYQDGQAIPMDQVLGLAQRIVAGNDIPITLDFEGAYGGSPQEVAANASAVAQTGVIGINFEDRHVQGDGLWSLAEQSARIAAIRAAVGPDFFINARTDVFMQSKPDAHGAGLEDAIARGQAYAAAGASGFFVPMLSDLDLITQICAQVPLPVNVMMQPALPDRAALAQAGVARISYGPASFVAAMKELTTAASKVF
jgi:2-methylisocitrate lyase-like PEP mutase family enzyme